MNLYSKYLTALLLLTVSFSAVSKNYIEGTHYSRVTNLNVADSSDQVGVVEYFSFSCPGCFAIEPIIKSLEQVEPSFALRRVHMPYGGRNAKLSQKAFVLMTLIGKEQDKDAIFNRIHVDKNSFDNEEELIDFFHSLGYNRSKVETALKSFTADTQIRKMNQEAMKNKIRSVPTIIVNGRYKINISALSSAKDFVSLIQTLQAQPYN